MKYILGVSLIVAIAVGCSAPALKTYSSSSTKSSSSFTMKKWEEFKMPNGLTLVVLKDHSLPRLTLSMTLKSGSLQDPEELLGLSSLVANLLDQGTTKKTAEQIADDLGQLGSEFSSSSGFDSSNFSVSSLSSNKDEILKIYSDVMLNPIFPEKEIKRLKAQVYAAIQKTKDHPSNYADLLIMKNIFNEKTYGRSSIGEIDTVKKINRQNLIQFYKKWYQPQQAMLLVSGDFEDDFIARVKSTFAKWNNSASTEGRGGLSVATSFGSPQQILFTKPGLKQTQIRFATKGVERTHPDYLVLKVANMILGGTFTSRLNQRVRDDLGLTYSISSGAESRKLAGWFEISTFTRPDMLTKTIDETRKVFQQFINEGVTSKELEAAKVLLVGQFPMSIETTDKLGGNLLSLRVYGVPDSYLTSFERNINAISLDQVNDAIKRHYGSKQLTTIIYADPQVKDQSWNDWKNFETRAIH